MKCESLNKATFLRQSKKTIFLKNYLRKYMLFGKIFIEKALKLKRSQLVIFSIIIRPDFLEEIQNFSISSYYPNYGIYIALGFIRNSGLHTKYE